MNRHLFTSLATVLRPRRRGRGAADRSGQSRCDQVVISEAYLNGGSAGATYRNKFVELYNPTDAPIDVSAGRCSTARPPRPATSRA